MKKLETLRKEIATTDTATFEALINCENIDVASITEKEKLCVLVFNEYVKAMQSNKLVKLVLDCNYSNSKLHDNEEYKLDYFRVIDEHNDSLARCYIHIGKEKVTTDIRFSCKKAVLAQTEALEKASFEIFRYKATQKVRNVRKQAVDYAEFIQTLKDALAILSNSKTSEIKKEEKDA